MEKRLRPERELGPLRKGKTSPLQTPYSNLPSLLVPPLGPLRRENGEGESWNYLACGIDINVTEGGVGGEGRLLKFCSPEKYISLK